MAEILIKGMEMPKNCNKCPFEKSKKEKKEYIWFCSLTNTECENLFIHNKDCPIVEVQPHGRLIDADVLKETLMKSAYPEQREWYFAEACQFIDEAPTIIEASKEGE